MIAYPASLLAVGGARTGIAPVNLLDVQDVNGNLYFWSDRRCNAPIAQSYGRQPILAKSPVTLGPGQYLTWAFAQSATVSPGSGSASASSESGSLHMLYQGPFTSEVAMTFADFTASLPSNAVVDAAYAVCVASAVPAHLIGNGGFTLLSGGGQVSSSIGASMASVEAFSATFSLFNSEAPAPGDEVNGSILVGYDDERFLVQDIAIAIVYSFSGGSGSPGGPPVVPAGSIYQPWLLTVPQLTFHRSAVTDVGSFVLQNLSGDTISRDFEKIMRKSALEGAFFVYRSFQADAQAAWIEVHGTLTVEDVGVDTVTLKGSPAINSAQDDTPVLEYSETCQWRWGSPQCGATGSTECQYSYQTCQVPERILVVLNNYEKNFGETTANVPTQVVNRRRRF